MMDVARFDMLVRNGVWKMMLDKGWYPIVASETITFRKSLGLWDRFTIESRLTGGLALTAPGSCRRSAATGPVASCQCNSPA